MSIYVHKFTCLYTCIYMRVFFLYIYEVLKMGKMYKRATIHYLSAYVYRQRDRQPHTHTHTRTHAHTHTHTHILT